MIRKLLLLVSILALAGCGFSLRIAQGIDSRYQPLLVITKEKFSSTEQIMNEALLRNDITVTQEIRLAHSQLVIFDEKEPERETITSNVDGDEQIFVMQWKFRFLVRTPSTQKPWNILLDDQLISTSKIVNKSQLEQQIGENYDSVKASLRFELAERIIRQLNSFQTK